MAAGGRDEKRLELKVGVLIMAAMAILVGFIVIISDISFGEKKPLTIFFQNPGALAPGVVVTIAGRTVGKVTQISFVGRRGPVNPATGKPTLVKVGMEIDADAYATLRKDVHFYITSKGVLGDPFLEIDPGTSDAPMSMESPLFGTDPPRLDLFLADAAQLVRSLNRLLVTNSEELDNLIRGSSNLVVAVDQFVTSGEDVQEGKERIARIMGNVEQLTVDTRVLLQDVRTQYVDNPKIKRTLRNMQSLTSTLDKELEGVLKDVSHTMTTLDRLTGTIGPEEQTHIRNSLNGLASLMVRADRIVARIDHLVGRVQQGEGTVGMMINDEEIYDDLKEFLRDIKHHPWKLIWGN